MSETSLSFQELQEASKVDLTSPDVLTASDGIPLSYRRYVPASPCAVVLFYHGGGTYSGAGYQHIGQGLQTQFNMAVYTPDIRGHGDSGGPRGDAPNPRQVWADITTFIKHIRAEFPSSPLFLGGHSSGAGLVLNYAGQPDHEPVDGYVLLSPQLGFRSQTDRPDQVAPFVKVDISAFIAYAVSSGALCGHDYAVQFNYPAEILANDPKLVNAITVTMSEAITPSAPKDQFASIDRPFGLWIGSEDELFLPNTVLTFADLAAAVRADSQASIIPGARHLSILVKAHEAIGPWVVRRIEKKNN
jgi:acylglycerol lipase